MDVDSGELEISYSINNTDPKTYTFPRTVIIEPNDTVQFVHDSIWSPSFDAVYWISMYITKINNDENQENDTLARWQGIGTATPIDQRPSPLALRASPNPMREELLIESLGVAPIGQLRIRLFDLFGKAVMPEREAPTLPYRLNAAGLAPGIYLLQVEDAEGKRFTQKVVKGE